MIPKHHICVATTVEDNPDFAGVRTLARAGFIPLDFEHGRPKLGEWHSYNWAPDFWAGIKHHLAETGITWVWFLAPEQDWPALELTGLVKDKTLERQWWVWGNPPTILPGQLHGRAVRLVGVGNWLPDGLPPAAEWLPQDSRYQCVLSDDCEDPDCLNQCATMGCAEVVKRILAFVHREDLGHLCSTVGGQALQSFRHLHLHHDVLVDDNYEALQLERACAIGFPVRCHFQGPHLGPIYVCDVNALYPWAQANYPYPRKRAFYSQWDDPVALRKASERFLLIARVDGEDPKRHYLVKRGRECVYDYQLQGDVLCGPDLDTALERGVITKVHECVAYEPAPIFDTWGPWAWQLRQRYKQRADKVEYALAKSLTVALWGKFAAQVGRWEPAVDHPPPPSDYEKWPWHKEDGTIVQCRTVAGVTDAFAEFKEGANSIPCIAAFVACYARLVMSTLIAVAGADTVLYQCADALHLVQEGFDRLVKAGLVDSQAFGKLKVAPPVADAWYYAPNVYRHDGVMKWAGRSVAAVEVEPGVWQWESLPSLDNTMMRPMHGSLTPQVHRVSLKELP